ncbi:MAG: hypothetical protein H0X30_28950 [Anaerolineae bacterium]|nr:hypothetical protein [Anaerolineae bacterium]
MNDYFLLDPDYRDFDFVDKQNLKFITVHGEQHGILGGALFMLIVSSVFLFIIFAVLFIDLNYWRNGEHTFGIVMRPCQASQDWYEYMFEGKDKAGNLRQFTGRTITGKNRPCRKVGDSIQVEYLRYDPDSSYEIIGFSSTLTDVCAFGFILIFFGYFVYSACRSIQAFLQARPKYARLKEKSLIIDGKISNVSKAGGLWQSRGGYYIEVCYEFWNDRQILRGIQIKRRDDLRSKPLPESGTPVRVLYADENTYVIL